MPKPFFLRRPSGWFVRFLVPLDLRPTLGQRFIVRRLRTIQPDRVRLAAAGMARTLSDAFQLIRGGVLVDIKKLLEQASRGELRDLTIGHAVGRDGTRYENVVINNDNDAALFRRLTEGTQVVSIPGLEKSLTLPPSAAPGSGGMDERKRGPDLSDAIEEYKRERLGKVNERGEHDVNTALDLFLTITGNAFLISITKEHVVNFELVLRRWPKNVRKRREFKGKTTRQILNEVERRERRGEEHTDVLADRTRQKYRDILAAFFNNLVRAGTMARAPTTSVMRQSPHRMKKAQVRRPYKDEELQQLFNPSTFMPWANGHPHRFWGPWVALYTGARLNEVAQLYCDDIVTIAGIPGFHVRNERPDQHIKTGTSCRFIPLAQAVLDAGFLDYVADVVAAKHDRLFPHLKYTSSGYGDALGDSFIRYLVDIGLKAGPNAPRQEKAKTAGMGIHWFRNGLSTGLIHGGTTPHTTSSITGHGHKGAMPGELAAYVDVATLPSLLAAINTLAFPPLPKYISGQFSKELLEAHRLPEQWKRSDAKRAEQNAVKTTGKRK